MSPLQPQQLLTKARRLREKEHRLRPSLRLRTLEEIREFIHARGLVSVLGRNELPSVINAILGKEWKPSRKGFAGWYDWWSLKISGQRASLALGQLDRDRDIVSTRIFRSGKTLVSSRLWPILDPIVKNQAKLAMEHKILSPLGWRVLETLEDEGPMRTDRLRAHLNVKGKEHTSSLHRTLSQLENYALIVGQEDPHPEKHLHANIWQLWRGRVANGLGDRPPVSYDNAVEEMLARTLDAAVLAPENEVEEWFPWKYSWAEAENKLLGAGRILRAGDFLVTARAA